MKLRINPILKSEKIKVGLTLGDPAGIGAEILVKALRKLSYLKKVEFIVIGDSFVINIFKPKGLDFKLIDLKNVSKNNFSFGKVKKEYAKASIDYLEKAVQMIKQDLLDCLVTLPISKEATDKIGFKWRGHTDYLAERFKVKDYAMMLLNKYIRISLVTTHIALKDVSKSLNKDSILKTIFLTEYALINWFNIKKPNLAVCSLNPHASDGGLMGREEEEIIIPAIRIAKRKKKSIFGPFSSDSLFLKAKEGFFDAVIAMYHDQALIPLKILDFSSGVNLTLGLPFIRTSPLHGTAFDIAGRGIASEASLVEAIKLAVKCYINQKRCET
ncbi:MAG: 4-hydroxythreonine-4-phosphate dehydrogenase PdxA [Candidatus Omnitrophica bacterium]|nr:4-hydroxythreonine-4-phosphate dehydrogenase PdxA [Candidatus Omnitrophota bacterium]